MGAGPVGLRLAIDCILLGSEVIIIEKRNTFSRNNVLHLWPFTIDDLRQLGAKKFYGKFCAGAIDHISKYPALSTICLASYNIAINVDLVMNHINSFSRYPFVAVHTFEDLSPLGCEALLQCRVFGYS